MYNCKHSICFVASGKVERFIDEAYQHFFMKGMNQLRLNDEYTDVTLSSGDVHIRCHRVVLAVASDFFNAIFRCGLKETTSDTVQVTMGPAILTCIVDYIYTGEIDLTVENVESVVKACDVLQLDNLKPGCEVFMEAHVALNNCVDFYRFAALYSLNKVHKKVKGLMLAEFKTIAFSDQFKDLSCSELVEYIKDDDIHVEDEDLVVESVMEWVRHDLNERRSSFETILEHIRLPYCTSDYLQHTCDMDDLLTPKCFKYLHEARRFQADTAHQHQLISCRTNPRNNFKVKVRLIVVGGLTCSEKDPWLENKVCQFYNEDTSCWETLTEMPPPVGRLYSVCCVGRSLLLTGGKKGRALDQCWLYDLATKKWEAMPPLITARYYHRSVSLGDCVYVFGEEGNGDKVLSSVECLDVKRRQWSALPDMPQAACAHTAVTCGNRVFVFGGQDARGVHLSCTQVLDTTRGQWSTRSDSPQACGIAAAVTLNDVIYVVGGGRRTCVKYDAATDTWTRLSRPREGHPQRAGSRVARVHPIGRRWRCKSRVVRRRTIRSSH